ncbi:helix-turn-helix domain-containing protein [Polymorphospora sp. NPDC051019]|uniref:helix-turn-helix domain-containing protein n=1 Tax=Polymorphospora sp. NPDC051019 TaxID=3155725 RepID=UPI0034246343
MASAPVSGADQDRVELLRSFLRARRLRLDRPDAGLLPRVGGRPGLSQDDLAEATGYSVRIISQLEQGRLRSPSAQLLQAVATALRLDPDERHVLWMLATRSAPPAQRYATAADPVLTRLADQLDPHPALVTDVAWRVLAANRAVARWFVDFDRIEPDRRNFARWLFCDPHARHAMVDWECDFAADLLDDLRATWARWPDDPALRSLVSGLRAQSPLVDRAWRDGAGIHPRRPGRTRALRRPGHTDPARAGDAGHHVRVEMTTLAPGRPDDERRLLVFLLPEGEEPAGTFSRDACSACKPSGGGR